jgi:hypothetical protein
MIDAERLEPATVGCRICLCAASGVDGRGDAERLTELAAAELAAFEISDETIDEFFCDPP